MDRRSARTSAGDDAPSRRADPRDVGRGASAGLMTERNPAKARSLVDARILRIGLVGTPAELILRLEGLAAMGVRHLSFGPPLGPDPLAAVEAIGREVIPYFRGR